MSSNYFWSPAVSWMQSGSDIHIGPAVYNGQMASIFPHLYFMTQAGMQKEQLVLQLCAATGQEQTAVATLVEALVAGNVLIQQMQDPAEALGTQVRLLQHTYDDVTFMDPQLLEQYKQQQLERTVFTNGEVMPLVPQQYPGYISTRRSARAFSGKQVPFSNFCHLLGVLAVQQDENGKSSRFHASAGGLYPLDVYIYVKEKQVEQVKPGLYWYKPAENALHCVSASCAMAKEVHYPVNRNIFETSAFSIFLVYNAMANMPKYKGSGYAYGLIEAGIVTQLLSTVCTTQQLGLCSVGELDFRKISRYFRLAPHQKLLHTLEIGYL